MPTWSFLVSRPVLTSSAGWLVARAVRRAFALVGYDPLVRFHDGESHLTLPLSHELPFYRVRHPYYSSNLGRLARAVVRDFGAVTAIDVGANVGDSINHLLPTVGSCVLAVEPSDVFWPILQANFGLDPRVTLVKSIIGDAVEEVGVDLRHVGGSATLEASERRKPVETLTQLLDRYPAFASANLLKIDTDGFDGAILVGAREWLRESTPVVFSEFDPSLTIAARVHPQEGVALLRQLGYSTFVAWSNTGPLAITGDLQAEPEVEERLAASITGTGRYFDIAFFPSTLSGTAARFADEESIFFAGSGR